MPVRPGTGPSTAPAWPGADRRPRALLRSRPVPGDFSTGGGVAKGPSDLALEELPPIGEPVVVQPVEGGLPDLAGDAGPPGEVHGIHAHHRLVLTGGLEGQNVRP